jgi:DNA ligase-1
MSFAELYHALSDTSSTSEKVQLLSEHFRTAAPADLAAAVCVLRGERGERALSSKQLRELCAEVSGLPMWLIDESYQIVGDLAETIAKLAGGGESTESNSLARWTQMLQPLRQLTLDERKREIVQAWRRMPEHERLVFNKLLTGGLRIGVSRGLVNKALAAAAGVEESLVAQRLLSNRDPATLSLDRLREPLQSESDLSPYPFYLAHPLEGDPAALGGPEDWLAEWKWDGIRAQIVRRTGAVAIWSRGEELVSESFPELVELARYFPEGAVLDGEVVALRGGEPADFALLQQRLNRKRLSAALLASIPVGFIAYDILECASADQREAPLGERRQRLQEIVCKLSAANRALRLSEAVPFSSWQHLDELRQAARERGAEGVMIKALGSPYGVGRKRGAWWKWKANPLTVDGVLVYAQRGHGRRAGLYSDYTFAVWRDGDLVPFAKAYSGLTDAEIREVDAFVKRHTREKFGPVRTVEPRLVFEIAFEGIQPSRRHKAGVAVRFPRILRWRRDKPAEEADSVVSLLALASSVRASGREQT